MPEKSAQTDAFWREYAETHNRASSAYTVVSFGDNPEMATRLADLVIKRQKRATASLVIDYSEDTEPLPQEGDHVVVVNGQGQPKLIWRTTEIIIKPLVEVDDKFAWDEGEGDRTRDWWIEGHREYFSQQAKDQGFTMHDGIETVLSGSQLCGQSHALIKLFSRTCSTYEKSYLIDGKLLPPSICAQQSVSFEMASTIFISYNVASSRLHYHSSAVS